MRIRGIRKLLVPVLVAGAVVTISAGTSSADTVLHGISVLKGCESPTTVGSLYECSYSITQSVVGDTATITSVSDVTASAGGPVASGNILPDLTLTLSGGAACNVGQTSCTIPGGGSIVTDDYAYYTVVAADFGLPSHILTDQATVGFTEACTGPGAVNCPVGPQSDTAGSSTLVTGAPTSTVTSVQSGGSAVTSVPLGATVSDQATVSGTGAGTPTGTVSFTFFTNGTCTPTGAAAGTTALGAGVATSNSEGPLVAGNYSFLASYNGDSNYAGSTGTCEPFTVAKAATSTVTTTVVVLKNGTAIRHAAKHKNKTKHKKGRGTPNLSVAAGATIADDATVSGTGAGTPTGTVTFTFFTNGTCTPTGAGAGTPTLSGGTAQSGSEGPLTAGSYSFMAVYSGDSNYPPATGACEPFTVTTPPPASCIGVTVSPNPLVETGQSEIHGVVQVSACPSYAGDVVDITASQLAASCATLSFEDVQNGLPPTVSPHNITVVLDDDGNATVVVDGSNCAPGTSVIEADLEEAPYLTALTQLVAQPPVVTAPGVTGYPNDEVETGDTTTGVHGASGNSDVYAVFYVEDNPVYAEQPVEIGSSQLEGRCGEGWLWEPGNGGTDVPGTGVNVGAEATTTLDDDGNAVFVFKGVSCAAGDSQVIADVLAGAHDTFTFDYTIDPPTPTI